MRKLVVAVGLLCSASLGASSLGSVLAAGPPASTVSASSPNPAPGVSGGAIVQYAMKFLGYPYTATGDSPSTGFSCIGFVSYVYRSLGINLPGDLGGAIAFAPQVAFSDLQPGDILYFQNTVWAGLSHAAIYIGGGRFIHAEWYNRGVVISSFSNDPVDGNYWTEHYLGANRPWTGASLATSPAVSQPLAPAVQPTPVTNPVPASPLAGPTRQLPSRPGVLVRVPALNVRSGPSAHTAISTVVTRGTRVTVLGRRPGWYLGQPQTWYRVMLPGGAVGWVIGAGIGKGQAMYQQATRFRAAAAASNESSRRAAIRSALARPKTVTSRIQTQGTVTVQVNGLRVHSAPSIGAGLVGSLYRGQKLPVVGSTGGWVKVQLSRGSPGWISRQFAQMQSAQRAPSASKTVTQSRAISRTASGAPRARVAVNVRARPSLSASIVTVLPQGGSYQAMYWSNGWARVRLSNGTQGWISGTVLGTFGSGARSSARAPAQARLQTSSTRGSVAQAALNVRRSPTLSAAIVSVVPPGGSFQILSRSNGWAYVRLADGGTGWMSGTILGNGSAAAGSSVTSLRRSSSGQSVSATHPVVTAGVRVRSGPGLNRPTIGLVAAGTRVQILGSSVGWTEVRLPSQTIGYILGIYVRQ